MRDYDAYPEMKKMKHVVLDIWKIHILPLLPNLLHNICQVRAESREVKNPTFRLRNLKEMKCYFSEVTSHGCASK